MIFLNAFIQQHSAPLHVVPVASPEPGPEESPLQRAPTRARHFQRWVWIVASRTTVEDAKAIADQYADRFEDVPVDLLVASAQDTTRYRVALGRYQTREHALIERKQWSDALPQDTWMLEVGM